ncbi:MAG: class I SAM-dependent methyltransferase [Nakamurella sp.]
MGFSVSPDAYTAFMGRYAEPLADATVAELQLRAGQRALDVGAGPGALTAELIAALGVGAVAAVDPSETFVAALRASFPGLSVQRTTADQLRFPGASFDVTVAQLVVHFMPDPVRGLAEMARVTRPGGQVAASVWDYGGGRHPLGVFWRAATDLDPEAPDESDLPGTRDGQLEALFAEVGLRDLRSLSLPSTRRFGGLEQWWGLFELGVGPAGDYVAALDADAKQRLRTRCAELLPDGPFDIDAIAWTVIGRR